MIRLTIDLLDPQHIGGQGTKEAVAMALEQFGPVRVVRVLDSEDPSVKYGKKSPETTNSGQMKIDGFAANLKVT